MTAPIEYNVPITPDTAVKMALSMTTQTLYYVDNNGNVQILASVAANGGNFTNVNITGGTIQGVALTIDSLDSTPIGANTPSTGRFTTLTSTGLASFNSLSTANATITGGSITGVSLTLDSLDNTPIGAATPSTGKFTTLQASGVITSTLATGTAPFSITSTTVVPNLNVSQLLGNTWAVPGTIGSTTPNSGAFTTISTNTVTSVTPVLGFNAANTSYASGSTVANNYLQTVLQNKSGTTGASTNYVLSNDLGTDSSYYGEFGMNSSVFSSGTPSDFFSINNGVYFSGHDGDITFGSGNGYKSYFAWGATGASAHVINTSGAIGLSTNLSTTPALSGTTGFGTAGQVMISNGSGAANTWSSTPTLVGTNFTGIPNGALTNSSITFGATAAALGSTVSAFNAVSIGATTASTGAFTTLSASSTVSGVGFSNYLAAPPAIGGTTPAAITGTTITANTGFSGPLNGTIGATTPNTGAFTTLSASSTVSGVGFSNYLAAPPAIGSTTPAAITGTTITATATVNTPNTFGFKNRIINGNMSIDQVNNGSAYTVNGSVYTLDRWKVQSSANNSTVQQIASTITGFSKSLKYTATAANTYMQMGQQIEYTNFVDLVGQTVICSFYAKANNSNAGSTGVTGRIRIGTSTIDQVVIFSGSNTDTALTISTTAARYSFTFSIPSNCTALSLETALGSHISGDGYEITGITFEKGLTATSIDVRSYGTELSLCQRYLQPIVSWWGEADSASSIGGYAQFLQTMRVAPSVSKVAGSTLNWRSASADNSSTTWAIGATNQTQNALWFQISSVSGQTAGAAVTFRAQTTNAIIIATSDF